MSEDNNNDKMALSDILRSLDLALFKKQSLNKPMATDVEELPDQDDADNNQFGGQAWSGNIYKYNF